MAYRLVGFEAGCGMGTVAGVQLEVLNGCCVFHAEAPLLSECNANCHDSPALLQNMMELSPSERIFN